MNNLMMCSPDHPITNPNKVFIMIIGGVASGKSHVYNELYSSFNLVDVDLYIANWKKSRNNQVLEQIKFSKVISRCIKTAEEELKNQFNIGNSVVNMGTGASLSGVLNKLRWARLKDYTSYIVLVDTPLEIALERNKLRAQKGDRNLIPESKVQRTNTAARSNFKIFQRVADYSVHIKC